jgi:hypothetical protein
MRNRRCENISMPFESMSVRVRVFFFACLSLLWRIVFVDHDNGVEWVNFVSDPTFVKTNFPFSPSEILSKTHEQ